MNFRHDLACSYCDKINSTSTSKSAESTSIIDLLDSSFARKSDHSQSRFSMLSTVSNTARQQSITRTQRAVQERSHAETVALSTRSKSEIKNSDNLTTKKHRVQIHIYTEELQDENLKIYEN